MVLSRRSNGEIRARPCRHAWVVCLSTISMVMTTKAVGLEKTIFNVRSRANFHSPHFDRGGWSCGSPARSPVSRLQRL